MYKKIKENKYFLLFILFFAYAESIQNRIAIRGHVNWFTLTPEAAFATLLTACLFFYIIDVFFKHWQKSEIFSPKEAFKIFTSSLLVYLLLIKLIGFIIAILFNTVSRNFNQETLILSTFSNLLDGFIYGSFYLVYQYYKKNQKQQQQISIYNQLLAESEINKLKAQLNPHFLFNNLNILDQLIEEDKSKASDFLNEFAEVYRYVLSFSDQKLIPIIEEINFVQKYFNIIKHKYGNAYVLEIENNKPQGYIVPQTLQLLIENAIQHNLGQETHPIHIKLTINAQITVSNNIVPKLHTKSISGRALNNLKEQYVILTKQQVIIQQTNEKFTVTIPLILSK